MLQELWLQKIDERNPENTSIIPNIRKRRNIFFTVTCKSIQKYYKYKFKMNLLLNDKK